VVEVLDVPEVMCCVLLCLLEVLEALDVPEVMHCVLLCLLRSLEALDVMPCVLGTLYVRSCGGFEISVVAAFSSQPPQQLASLLRFQNSWP